MLEHKLERDAEMDPEGEMGVKHRRAGGRWNRVPGRANTTCGSLRREQSWGAGEAPAGRQLELTVEEQGRREMKPFL